MNMERKIVSFEIEETKEISSDKQKVGTVKGLASTFGNTDRVGDIIEQGAFTNTIKQFKKNGRNVRMLFQHDGKEIIGLFNPTKMVETEKGVEVTGEINLDVQRGKEVFALAKQGAISDFSIGFSIPDGGQSVDKKGRRIIKEVNLWEISMVTEPANPKAQITQVKNFNFESEDMKLKDVEEYLSNPYPLSRKERKSLISFIKGAAAEDAVDAQAEVETEAKTDMRDALVKQIDDAMLARKLDEYLKKESKND